MTRIKLKNIDRFIDRHGKPRYYFRVGQGPRIRLKGEPGSPEFVLAYEQAVRGETVQQTSSRKERGAPGTFGRLVQDYFSSPEYLRMTASTRVAYRRVIERLLVDENIAHRLVREMTREHVKRMVSKRAATPGAANDVLKKLKILLNFAIDGGLRSDNPASRIKKFPGGEFHTWTDSEIETYERHWPLDTTARLAFALLLFTGQRRSDVVRMTWDDVEGNAVRVTQQKTGTKLRVPIHPALAEILTECPLRTGTLLATAFGKPFTANGFGGFMADRIGEAGLPDRCVTHGLRKAAARRLAEAGCSANEIAAITGHATLTEVTRYTKAAEQKRLASSAMDRLAADARTNRNPKPTEGVGKNVENTSDINAEIAAWRSLRESNPSFKIENLAS